ncbi:MAG: hypothetical protein NT062_34365 [Proteobacteria bacterium]|nr:hypothetical protein [Pseudomonadota bacterium]
MVNPSVPPGLLLWLVGGKYSRASARSPQPLRVVDERHRAAADEDERHQLVQRVRRAELRDDRPAVDDVPQIIDAHLAWLARDRAELALDAEHVAEEHAEADAEQGRVALRGRVGSVRDAELVGVAEHVEAGGATDLDVGRGRVRDRERGQSESHSGDGRAKQSIHEMLDP